MKTENLPCQHTYFNVYQAFPLLCRHLLKLLILNIVNYYTFPLNKDIVYLLYYNNVNLLQNYKHLFLELVLLAEMCNFDSNISNSKMLNCLQTNQGQLDYLHVHKLVEEGNITY